MLTCKRSTGAHDREESNRERREQEKERGATRERR